MHHPPQKKMDQTKVHLPTFSLSYSHNPCHRKKIKDLELGLIITGTPISKNQDVQLAQDFSTNCNHLLALPLELRTKTYHFVLISSTKLTWRGQYAKTTSTFLLSLSRSHTTLTCNKPQSLPSANEDDDDESSIISRNPNSNISSLLLTCQLINAEAACIFYRHNDFVFKCRTPRPRHHLTNFHFPIFIISNFIYLTKNSHTLRTGLPLAFQNPFFRLNVRSITFACSANLHHSHSRHHECGFNDNNHHHHNDDGDRIAEITNSCPALLKLAIHEPETEMRLGMGMVERVWIGCLPRDLLTRVFLLMIAAGVATAIGLLVRLSFKGQGQAVASGPES